eukprot:jgi/Botrbrau1/13515/Bobra.0347s0002.2
MPIVPPGMAQLAVSTRNPALEEEEEQSTGGEDEGLEEGGDESGSDVSELERPGRRSSEHGTSEEDSDSEEAGTVDSGEAELDTGEEESDPETAGPGNGTKDLLAEEAEGNQASAFARAFQKVVGSSERGPTGGDPILAASKSVLKRQRVEDEEQQAKRKAKKLRMEMRKRGHVAVPPKGENPEVDAREKALMRLATRGVVNLFNAIAVAQKQEEVAALQGAKPVQAVKASKSAFLATLKGDSAATKGGGKVHVGPKEQAVRGEPSGVAESSWAVVKEGFAGLQGGRKLKDWDKELDGIDVGAEGEVLEGFSESDGSDGGAW